MGPWKLCFALLPRASQTGDRTTQQLDERKSREQSFQERLAAARGEEKWYYAFI
jgi:hypothetical protein